MEIGPINNAKTAGSRPESPKEKDRLAKAGNQPADDVRISTEARERLQDQRTDEKSALEQERPVKDSVEYWPDMVGLIQERIDSGFYERASVKSVTLEKMIDEMLENINQFYK